MQTPSGMLINFADLAPGKGFYYPATSGQFFVKAATPTADCVATNLATGDPIVIGNSAQVVPAPLKVAFED